MDLLAFGLALLVVSAMPGPVVTLLTARVLAGDVAGAARFAAGIAAGKVILLSAIVTGVGALLGTDGDVMAVFRALGVVYLAWVSACLWRGAEAELGCVPVQEPGSPLVDLGAGLTASLSSPFLVAFFLTASPSTEPFSQSPLTALLAITVLASAAAHGVYIALAASLRHLLVERLHRSRLQRAMAGTVALAALWLAVS